MKLYCKIKQDGVWKWLSADSPWKKHIAKELCECRVCKPNFVRQTECLHKYVLDANCEKCLSIIQGAEE